MINKVESPSYTLLHEPKSQASSPSLTPYQRSILYIQNLQIPPPPPFPVLQTSPEHTFSQPFGAVFRLLRGKFNELGCKIYTPYGFFMLIYLFLYLFIDFSSSFSIFSYGIGMLFSLFLYQKIGQKDKKSSKNHKGYIFYIPIH